MLSGENGILQQTTIARTRTIHANVLEQMQLEASAYKVDKTTGTYSNSLIDYLKSKSIISNISGEEDKWLINITTLLGSNQSMGKGTYPNDVYVLEKQATSTSSIVNTKVATTMPIKIAATSTNQVTYKIIYYGNGTNLINLGALTDESSDNNNDLAKIANDLTGMGAIDFVDDFLKNTNDYIYMGVDTDNGYVVLYNNKRYKLKFSTYNNETHDYEFTDVEEYTGTLQDIAEAQKYRTSLDLEIGETKNIYRYIFTNMYEIENVEFESNDESIATVDNNGNVTGISEGNTTITLKGKVSGNTIDVMIIVAPVGGGLQ